MLTELHFDLFKAGMQIFILNIIIIYYNILGYFIFICHVVYLDYLYFLYDRGNICERNFNLCHGYPVKSDFIRMHREINHRLCTWLKLPRETLENLELIDKLTDAKSITFYLWNRKKLEDF